MRSFLLSGTLAVGACLCMNGLAGAAEVAIDAGDDASGKLIEALVLAKPGDIITLGAGRIELTEGLSLDVDDVTLRGAGPDRTILSLKGQTGSGEGLLVTSNRAVLEGFAVENAKGDGVKSKGSDKITFRNLRVEWTGGPNAKNGSYGVYPVASKHVLIDGVSFVSTYRNEFNRVITASSYSGLVDALRHRRLQVTAVDRRG